MMKKSNNQYTVYTGCTVMFHSCKVLETLKMLEKCLNLTLKKGVGTLDFSLSHIVLGFRTKTIHMANFGKYTFTFLPRVR